MQRDREVPWNVGYPTGHSRKEPIDPHGLLVDGTPLTPIQALMEAAPHVEPQRSVLEQIALRDVLADAVDGLEDHLRLVFEYIAIADISLRELGRLTGIPKSTLHRWYLTAIEELQAALIDNPTIQSYLGGTDD